MSTFLEDLDVIFEVPIPNSKDKKVKEFHGIRGMFAVHTEVFEAMLFGKMMEGKKNARVRLDDVTPEAFEYLQRLFYGMRPCLEEFAKYEGCVECLLYSAKKYLIPKLVELCEAFLEKKSKEHPENKVEEENETDMVDDD